MKTSEVDTVLVRLPSDGCAMPPDECRGRGAWPHEGRGGTSHTYATPGSALGAATRFPDDGSIRTVHPHGGGDRGDHATMSTTFAHIATTTSTTNETNPFTAPITGDVAAIPGRRSRWPIFGVLGGAAGFAASLAGIQDVTEEQARAGVSVIDHVSRASYHASFLLGLVSIGALFVTAAAWRRWAEERAPRDIAARTIGSAIGAVATVNIVFACLAGSMALYLPGGTDNGWLSRDAMFVNFTLLDFGQLLGWWGGMVAAGCVASLALRRRRLLPRWMGVFSIVAMLPPLAMAAIMALPGFVGLTMPIWLVVISIGMVCSRKAHA